MKFIVIPNNETVPVSGSSTGYLWTDAWDDWFKFSTLYVLTYFDKTGQKYELGEVKIGQFDMESDQRRPNLPKEFETLDDRFFSLGQDSSYYSGIMTLPNKTKKSLLTSLQDVVENNEILLRARSEKVLGVSLMRFVNERTILGQFRRILRGGAELTKYSFQYVGPKQINDKFDPLELSFSVVPESKPPTNVHVIIGRNGVGKSFLLNSMSRALVCPGEDGDRDGKFIDDSTFDGGDFHVPFGNVVSVTFSAFDDFPIIRERRNVAENAQYTNIGLRKRKVRRSKNGDKVWDTVTLDPTDLTKEFISSAKACTRGERRRRWVKVLRTLESDPIFEEAKVSQLLKRVDGRFGEWAGRLFRRLSSGHKIVLLTVTRLVEKVEERTLVLLDEPEAHLHPPLLAAFIRGLSDLLIDRNGVGILATHSPVVLQEVPCSCVWKVRRYGGTSIAERVRNETFAEHVGHLTHEVFGLEVTKSGFHRMITDDVSSEKTFESMVAEFQGEVGSEGRALISMLLAQGESKGRKDV